MHKAVPEQRPDERIVVYEIHCQNVRTYTYGPLPHAGFLLGERNNTGKNQHRHKQRNAVVGHSLNVREGSRRRKAELGDGSRCCQREVAEQINVNSVPGIPGRAAVELEISANKKHENIKREGDRA